MVTAGAGASGWRKEAGAVITINDIVSLIACVIIRELSN